MATKTKILLCIVGFFVLLVFIMPLMSTAVSGMIPFGGKITSVDRTRCTCLYAPAAIVNVGSPKGGRFIYYYYFSKLYEWYSVNTNNNVLGIASPFGICLQQSGFYCTPVDYAPSIIKIGTSAR